MVFARALLIIGILALVFCAGGYLGQATFEPQVIIERETHTIYQIIEKVIYQPVEKVIVKEVEKPLCRFESVDELEKWLSGVMLFSSGDCDDFAMGLQELALETGYIMSFEVIWADEYNGLFESKIPFGRAHAINLVIIGNDVYYIEPQTHEVVFRGHLD